MTAPAHTLRLLLGDQLNPAHSWFSQQAAETVYVLMEVRQETDYVRHHAQKIIAIFAAMRDLARQLREQGHRVRYVTIDAPSNRQSITDNLSALMRHYGAHRLQYQAPDEWRLDQQLRTWGEAQPFTVEAVDSEHFLTSRQAVARFFENRQQWLMEHFYRHMRKQYRVLLDASGGPEGGQWNFDKDNRHPWHGTPPAPNDTRPTHDHTTLWQGIQAAGVASMGDADAGQCRWPLNRAEALGWLEHFITTRLPHFGRFEDAMSTQSGHLFHSQLSFALNTKMLTPREVVARAEAAYRQGTAPLAAVEGFIRQIIGWREYVRGIYWAHMPGYAEQNALHGQRDLPPWFWTGQTRMHCLQQAIGQSLRTGYAHHIQRLMIIGNFSLLAGLAPAAVHAWYLGVYVDAFEWVELPNTLGMSQFADGGLLATKPYVSSAAYIDRMSDYCDGCAYNKKLKTGPDACPYNALYWAFFDRHETLLGGNPRLGIVYRQLQKMTEEQRQDLRAQADQHLSQLDTL